MKVISAANAKNGFGLLIDTARAEPVAIAKHGRAVAVVLSVEEYERLQGRAMPPEATVKAASVDGPNGTKTWLNRNRAEGQKSKN